MSKNHVKRKMEKKDKILLIIAAVIVIVILVIPLSIKTYSHIHANSKVKMKDSGMESVMTELYARWDKETKEKRSLTYGDLDKVTKFYTGSWSYYESLADLTKCKNLEELAVNFEAEILNGKKQLNPNSNMTVISEDKLKKFCGELEEILKTDKKLNDFSVMGNNENLGNVDFLKNGSNLKKLVVRTFNIDDYSGIGECKNLEELVLVETTVKTANQLECLQNLQNLKRLYINETPLSRDENELKKLQEMLPDVEIDSKPFKIRE